MLSADTLHPCHVHFSRPLNHVDSSVLAKLTSGKSDTIGAQATNFSHPETAKENEARRDCCPPPIPSRTAENHHLAISQQQRPRETDQEPQQLLKRKWLSTGKPTENPLYLHEETNEAAVRPPSRDDLIPAGLRNKKMRPTDCLLFAATLLEEDSNSSSAVATSPRSTAVTALQTKFSLSQLDPGGTRSEPLSSPVKVPDPRTLSSFTNLLAPSITGHSSSPCFATPRDVDVLCGRGGLINKHPGNVVYRKVVDYNKPFYQSVHKKYRIFVSQSIVQSILNSGGRFLILGAKGASWIEIGYKRAVQKTSQALRERVPNPEEDNEVEAKQEIEILS